MFSCSLSASVALSSFWFQNGLKIASGLPIEFVTDTIINEAPKNLYSMDEIFTWTSLKFEFKHLNIKKLKKL